MIEEEKEAIKTLEEILKEWQKIVDIEDPIERECEMSCYMEDMPFYQIKILLKLVEKQQKEIKEYKRYFKLAISDLQSEGYMQMPYENIEKYYSKREDII